MAKRGNPQMTTGTPHQYTKTIGEVPGEVLSIRVEEGIKQALKEKFGSEYTKEVRKAIAELLKK
jgi:hypothetical protein